jgi:hypothetical protein
MRRLSIGGWGVVVAGLLGALACWQPVQAADPQRQLRVQGTPAGLMVEAKEVSLEEVLQAIGAQAGFTVVVEPGVDRPPVTVTIRNAPIETVLAQVLRGENYSLVYRDGGRAIARLLVLSPPTVMAARRPAPVGLLQMPAGAVPPNSSLHARSIPTISQGHTETDRSVSQKRTRDRGKVDGAEGEPPLTVGELLQSQAFSALGGWQGETVSAHFSGGGATDGSAQPFVAGVNTAAVPPATPSSEGLTQEEALAIATRVAQQNLQALVEGLTTVTHSLRETTGTQDK